MKDYSLLGISGSLRSDATNRKLIREASRFFAPADYVEADIQMPLYNADAEERHGIPSEVTLLSKQIAAADAVVVSTPEYNKGPSGALKNAFDWLSRAQGSPLKGKPVAVMSASAGRAGGERAQTILRNFLVPFRPRILQGPELHVASCTNEFDDNDELCNPLYIDCLRELMQILRQEVDLVKMTETARVA
ncbi:MAG: NAD(P)H-dependent oxidoreductase [Aestuariivita sp.]|nr:NAD(P)H-dependent oxidoreductase [Aestuariivita sp.]MCY4204026.1 NAD(P)H-dependent oxidoreductase [Aestuariivita sp.]MCY4289759.1 NAD(P)H-dependent oxidoreductase [Aestuariivita sp.]MCY4347637.1 NAD(P)H-dependent oxidoreductase [Aestuariivita sp.]